MTGPFDRHIAMHGHARARTRVGRWRVRAVLPVLLLIATALAGATARADDMVAGRVSATTANGFTRLVFKLGQPVPARVSMTWPIMIIHFSQPVDVSVDRLNEGAPSYISAARRDPDGTAVRIALVRKVKFHVIPAGERLFIDLLPESWSGLLPGLPQDVIDELSRRASEADKLIDKARLATRKALADPVRVKVATQPTFTRYVFDLPTETHVDPERGEGTYTLHFDQPIKWDLADAVSALPPTVRMVDSTRTDRSAEVHFNLVDDPEVRTFRDGHSFVVDIGHVEETAKRALTDGAAQLAARESDVPTVAPPETMPAQATKPDKPAPPPAATVDMGDAPPMVDMAAPDAPPGAKPAPPPSPQIMVPEPGRAAEKKAPPTKKDAMAKSAMQKPAMAKPSPHKPETTKPGMAKPETTKPGMTQPAMVARGDQHAAAPPKHEAARAAPKMPKAPKKLEPIAPQSKAATEKPATPDAAMHGPTPVEPHAAQVPSPNPNAPVVAGLHRDGQTLQIEFPFAVETPAAVFRRDDMLWLVFDNPAKIDLGKLVAESGGAVRNATVKRSKDGATVVRIRLNRPRLISVDSDGPSWMVTVADTVTTASAPLGIVRLMVGGDRAKLVVPFKQPGKLHRLHDPEVGDHLLVMTGLAPARGFLRSQEFVELDVLASRQGVVIKPIADDVTGKVDRESVVFTRPGGLALSAATDVQQQSAASFRAATFDNQMWTLDRSGSYFQRQSELIRAAAAASPNKRKVARLNLARFYLAHHMSAEALGVLNVAFAREDGDVTGSVLKSVANIMLDRPKDALKNLSQPQVENQLEAPLWRAIAYAKENKWVDAHKRFANVETAVAGLPPELQRMALMAALHAAVEVRDFSQAERLVNMLDGIGMPPATKPEFDVLVGRLDQGLGRTTDALAKYEAAASVGVGPAAAQGELHSIELRHKLGQMPTKEAVAALETLTTLWRGDATEAEGLRLLAHLYTKEARYREAFHVMRVALLAHPNSDLTRKIRDEAASTFESLFLSHKGDTLPPIEALGLFYDYRELTPIGRRGDEMIRRLADRLVAVDLLGQAAKLLQHQVDHRLEGAARAQVATRLAVIYLMDHKPDRALATLQSTRIAQLNNEVRDQRLLLQGRALSDLGRYDLALQVIKEIKGHEAMRLRADILWSAHRWDKAAEEIELLYGNRWRDFRPLDAKERFDILRAAVGYALGNDAIGLQRFREKYAAKMERGPDGHAFNVVSAPIGTNNAEFRSVAKHVAGLDTLDAFLKDMRKRYPDSKAVFGKGAADTPAATKPQSKAAAPKLSPPQTVTPNDAKAGAGAPGKTPDKTPAGTPQTRQKPPGSNNSAANTRGALGERLATAAPVVPRVPQGVPLLPDTPTGSTPRP